MAFLLTRLLPDSEYLMSLQEVADELGYTRQLVWDIERRALKKLKIKMREWEGYERDYVFDSVFRVADDNYGADWERRCEGSAEFTD